MNTVTVTAGKSEYPVHIGAGLLKSAGELAAERTALCTIMLVSDDTVFSLYGEAVVDSFSRAGFTVCTFVFPNGERSKCPDVLFSLLEAMAANNLTRTDVVAALGGGVTGDLAGFAASIYLRGIRFFQLPTTLLAAVDSSVGGKTGININAGKNLVGAFLQPLAVIYDTHTVETLPVDTISDGIAESIKCGMICSNELFDRFENGSFSGDLVQSVSQCVAIKGDIVSRDERDGGVRQLLNFGHTLAHSIEAASELKISHGHAVSMGMVAMCRAAEKLQLGEPCSQALTAVLEKYQLPVECPFDLDELLKYILSDKKRRGDTLTLVMPRKVGECFLHTVSVGDACEILRAGLR